MIKKIVRDGIRYEIMENNEVAILGLRNKDIKYLVIPDEVEGMPVKWINEHAFMGEHFETVSLPKGITVIPNAAFYNCHALKKIEFRGNGDGEIRIMQCGIGFCNNLKSIKSTRPIKKVFGEASIQECNKLKFMV